MGQVVGDLLPLSVGVAISPVPIVAVVLMLVTPRAAVISAAFVSGWIAGITVAATVFVLLAGAQDLDAADDSSAGASWVKLVLGLLLLLLAGLRWRSRPDPHEEPTMPSWFASLDTFSAGRAAGLAVLLSTLNPKNLLLCAAAGTAIAGGHLSHVQDVSAVALFAVLAAGTVIVPVAACAVGRKRMAGPLESLRGWLTHHNVAVMGTLLLVIGAVLAGQGIGALT